MTITHTHFGNTPEGVAVDLFTLTNAKGVQARISNYGCTLVSLLAPDRTGKLGDIVLGFDTLDGYLGKHPFFGCIAGRYANRIGGAAFTIDGKHHAITATHGANSLHGGLVGFNRKMWQSLQTHDGVSFSYTSKDGEEGYPGNLSVNVSYSLSKDNALAIHYQATTDAPTVLNLTNHSYFNLDGAPSILDHELLLNCDDYLPTNAAMIPSGEIRSVADTPFDFRLSRRIGDRISQDNPDLNNGGGYDHNWCINGAHGNLRLAARVYAASSGRILECYTDQPGVQFYAGNFIARNGTIRGKNGAEYGDRSGLCLETQHYPDSPNHPNFPSTLLRPGEVFNSTTVYLFGSASS